MSDYDPQPTLPPEVIRHHAEIIAKALEPRLRETMALIEDDTQPMEMRRSYVAQTILALTVTLQEAYPSATHIDGIDLMLEIFTILLMENGAKTPGTGMGKAHILSLLKPQ